MSPDLLASLTTLALIDSTSFGTLLVPLWLMLAPGQLRPGRVGLFLLTVAACYLALGVALATGATALLDHFDGVMKSAPARVAQYVVGFGLMAAGITMEPWTKAGKAKRAARRAAREARTGPGRLTRWRGRATEGTARATAVVALAATAVAIEAATMVPYMAAVGLLTASELSLAATSVVLAGYCVVMITPALALLAIRLLLRERIAPTLTRLEGWMNRHSREATAWIVFLLGMYLVATA